MLGLRAIASTNPDSGVEARSHAAVSGTGPTHGFAGSGTGTARRSRRHPGNDASDLCVAAATALFAQSSAEPANIQCVVVVSQCPDGYGIPHTAAIVQRKLGIPESCSSFDIGLGGSGYVYGLSVIQSFMRAHEMQCGLLFTADLYSRIIDGRYPTEMPFGDAATVTLLADRPKWVVGRADFGTSGSRARAMEVRLEQGGKLYVDGAIVQDFAIECVPLSVKRVLDLNEMTMGQVDRIIIQQAGRGLIEEIGKKMNASEKLGYYAGDYGDTGSSSIPLALEHNLAATDRRVVISGFGSGLSWATTVLTKVG